MEAYFTERFVTRKAVCAFVKRVARRVSSSGKEEKNYKFIAHILVSTFERYSKDKYSWPEKVPIPARLIEKNLGRRYDPTYLEGVITIYPPIYKRRCRRYEIDEETYDEFIKEHIDGIVDIETLFRDDSTNLPFFYNLMTGQQVYTVPRSKAAGVDVGGRRYNQPKLVWDSIQALSDYYVNTKHIFGWIQKLLKYYEEVVEKYSSEDSIKGVENKYKSEVIACRRRISRDVSAIYTLCSQGAVQVWGEVYKYKAAYAVQKSGRITEKGGGFQGATRYMKHLALKGVRKALRERDEDFFSSKKLPKKLRYPQNFDLSNSQANILKQFFEDFGISCPWLEEYLERGKGYYAKKLGIDKDTWKLCFYAVCFGAIPTRPNSHVRAALLNVFKGNKKVVKIVIEMFLEETKEFRKAVSRLREELFSSKDKEYTYVSKGIRFWKNACDKRYKEFGIRVSDGKIVNMEDGTIVEYNEKKTRITPKRIKNRVLAFFIQGQEAAFIHRLTLVCYKKKVNVYHNEHDGLVADLIEGELFSNEIIEEASKKSHLKHPVLKEKLFCEKKERKKYEEGIKLSKKGGSIKEVIRRLKRFEASKKSTIIKKKGIDTLDLL